MKLSKFSSFLFLASLILNGCIRATAVPPTSISPTSNAPEIKIDFANNQIVELTTETVSQPNCEGTAEVENQIEKSRSIEHTLEAQGGVSVNANGQIGFAGTDVELGATVAAQLGTSYGLVETIAKSVTVKAKPGTNMQHLIRLTELWKSGNAKVKVGNQETTVPFRFRYDFAIELVSSQDAGCNSQTATPNATATNALPTTTPTGTGGTLLATSTANAINPQADTGWQGEYFDNNNFQEPVAYSRIDSEISFDWKDGNPAPGIPVDGFSVRWTRCLDLESRYYIFTLRADDRAKVLVDDIFVLDTYYVNQEYERQFAVSAGRHCIKVEYTESGQSANIYFNFKPGDTFSSADESVAWKGEYFNNDSFKEPATFIRNDPAPSFDWKEGNPAPGIPVDGFSVRWTRCLELEDRYYNFTIRGDDSVKVFVDDIFVLDTYYINQEYQRQFAVSAGQHCIKVEYRDTGQSANLYFDFRPGDTYNLADESVAWKGEYFNNDSFKEPVTFIRNDPAPSFVWKEGNPAPNIPVDNFSVRWSRCLTMEGREYTFTLRADDFARVFVDNIQVVDTYYINQDYVKPFIVSAGQHCIKIEYRDSGQSANIYFGFK